MANIVPEWQRQCGSMSWLQLPQWDRTYSKPGLAESGRASELQFVVRVFHHKTEIAAHAAASPLQISPQRGTFAQMTALRSEEHTSELQSLRHLVCRLLL